MALWSGGPLWSGGQLAAIAPGRARPNITHITRARMHARTPARAEALARARDS